MAAAAAAAVYVLCRNTNLNCRPAVAQLLPGDLTARVYRSKLTAHTATHTDHLQIIRITSLVQIYNLTSP